MATLVYNTLHGHQPAPLFPCLEPGTNLRYVIDIFFLLLLLLILLPVVMVVTLEIYLVARRKIAQTNSTASVCLSSNLEGWENGAERRGG